MIKTLYDGHLMLQGQFRILLDNVGEGLQACSIIEKVFLLDFQQRHYLCTVVFLFVSYLDILDLSWGTKQSFQCTLQLFPKGRTLDELCKYILHTRIK